MIQKYFSPDAAAKAGMDPTRFPQTDEEVQRAEETIARELEKLSMEEHEKIIFDIHGIPTTTTTVTNASGLSDCFYDDDLFGSSKAAEMTPTSNSGAPNVLPSNICVDPNDDEGFLQAKMDEMDGEIKSLMDQKCVAFDSYLQARDWNEKYVTSRSLRLMCLRAESMNVQSAAELLLQHFQVKAELFGHGEVLGRDVRLSDLSSEEREILNLGNMQILPTRDAAGRAILMYRCRKYCNLESLARCHWYFVNRCLKDEETQKSGFVILFFLLGNKPPFVQMEDFQVIQRIHYVRTGIPERTVGAHFCFENQWFHRPFVAGIQLFLNSAVLPRVRTHLFQTVSELYFRLQCFGIDTTCCPLEADGSWNVNRHLEWLGIQERAEEKQVAMVNKDDGENCDDEILVPRKFDVLFGAQHKRVRQHTGNLRILHLVEMYWVKYEQSGKYEKTQVADRLVQVIYESQGRFLKWHDGKWLQVEHDVAREKVSHYFRYMRAKMRAQMTQDEDSSDLREEQPPRNQKRRSQSSLSPVPKRQM